MRLWLMIAALCSLLWAQTPEINASEQALLELAQKAEEERMAQELKEEQRRQLTTDLQRTDEVLARQSVWQNSYGSYLKYHDVKNRLEKIQKEIKALSKVRKNSEEREQYDFLVNKELILQDQLTLLKDHADAPFATLLKPEEIETVPDISNPFDIFTGISFKKRLDSVHSDYVGRGKELRMLTSALNDRKKSLEALQAIDENASRYADELSAVGKKLQHFENGLETHKATGELYKKRMDEMELHVDKEIKKQGVKLLNLGTTILVLLVVFFVLKYIIKRYITDNERFYMANKIITFVNITLILLIIFFTYIDKVGYLVTVLGFASAGIAIAMRDWFMSILGWLVIVFGGSIHVGDRIRVEKDGMVYVGDVLDISLLRITLLEDVTLTSYEINRRAGRIIFVPNNYVFTMMIANYSHHALKTVWDGIDITITFDSNHKKAAHLAKEITRKYAKGYTDITRKQLNKLRSSYNLKNSNVEPRIFVFIKENGLCISSWYLTNAYATLTLRSAISAEIVDAFNAEADITIAYPTQRLHVQRERSMPSQGEVV
ncbi:MAG: mechanosensitive ion channel [Campylobacterales bacterium]|nr:mechanosensitive ion channel [Campylobacterales bacterium]